MTIQSKYHPTVNDYAIRIAQLEEALGTCSRRVRSKPGLVTDSILAEIADLSSRIESLTEQSCDVQSRTWRY